MFNSKRIEAIEEKVNYLYDASRIDTKIAMAINNTLESNNTRITELKEQNRMLKELLGVDVVVKDGFLRRMEYKAKSGKKAK